LDASDVLVSVTTLSFDDAGLDLGRSTPVRRSSSADALFRVRGRSLARAHDRTLGWGRLAGKGVQIKMIDGAHYNILELPNVHSPAKQLKVSLEVTKS